MSPDFGTPHAELESFSPEILEKLATATTKLFQDAIHAVRGRCARVEPALDCAENPHARAD